jgi:hypothetical protein
MTMSSLKLIKMPWAGRLQVAVGIGAMAGLSVTEEHIRRLGLNEQSVEAQFSQRSGNQEQEYRIADSLHRH